MEPHAHLEGVRGRGRGRGRLRLRVRAHLEGAHGRPRVAAAAAARADVEDAQRLGRRHLREREQSAWLVAHEGDLVRVRVRGEG